MCLAVPGKLVRREDGSDPLMGTVNFGGILKNVCLDWIPDVRVGEYVIVHVGFAISKVNESEALETLQLFKDMQSGSHVSGKSEAVQRKTT